VVADFVVEVFQEHALVVETFVELVHDILVHVGSPAAIHDALEVIVLAYRGFHFHPECFTQEGVHQTELVFLGQHIA